MNKQLSKYEIFALKALKSANRLEREPNDVILDCRRAVTAMLQHFCIIDCGLTEKSHQFKDPWRYLTHDKKNSFFWGTNKKADNTFQQDKHLVYKDIHAKFREIKDVRKSIDYQHEDKEMEFAELIRSTLKHALRLYFNDIMAYSISDFPELKEFPKSISKYLFKKDTEEAKAYKEEFKSWKNMSSYVLRSIDITSYVSLYYNYKASSTQINEF